MELRSVVAHGIGLDGVDIILEHHLDLALGQSIGRRNTVIAVQTGLGKQRTPIHRVGIRRQIGSIGAGLEIEYDLILPISIIQLYIELTGLRIVDIHQNGIRADDLHRSVGVRSTGHLTIEEEAEQTTSGRQLTLDVVEYATVLRLLLGIGLDDQIALFKSKFFTADHQIAISTIIAQRTGSGAVGHREHVRRQIHGIGRIDIKIEHCGIALGIG